MEVPRTQFSLCFLLFLFYSAHSFVESFNVEEDVKRSDFPDGFLFGTSTSAYQIEGAYLQDGKSFNNWDVFNHIPRHGENVDNGDVANDHYHRYLEDIELMHNLGVNSYRFSISWSRILPRGRFGEVNPSGIMFYNKVIDSLLLKGIEPFVTIHHHDLPQELQDRHGSWLSPRMQEEFVHFAKICFRRFGDRVKYWSTINEPNLVSDMGYIRGKYPPAHCSEPFGNCSVGNSDLEPLIVMHNMLLAHAKTAKLYREIFQPTQGGFIGMVGSMFMYVPLTDDKLDKDAASRALAFNVAWTFDPLVFGDYPPEMHHYHGNELPRFSAQEAKNIKGSIDFIGINHYATLYTKDCIHSKCSQGGDRAVRGFAETSTERNGVPIGEPTGMGRFFVVPTGMEEIVDYVKNRYNNMPMFVTENGYSIPQSIPDLPVEYQLEDVKRIKFHISYLSFLARAIRNGADVRGYFIWSLMDNYEWAAGYRMKFGVYYIDRQTLERIPKLSAQWYRNFLTNTSKSNGDVCGHQRACHLGLISCGVDKDTESPLGVCGTKKSELTLLEYQ